MAVRIPRYWLTVLYASSKIRRQVCRPSEVRALEHRIEHLETSLAEMKASPTKAEKENTDLKKAICLLQIKSGQFKSLEDAALCNKWDGLFNE